MRHTKSLLAGLLVPLAAVAAIGAPPRQTAAAEDWIPPTPAVAPSAANPGNPLAGRPWGVYQGPGDQAWEPYMNATGSQKELLGKIARQPKAKWFGQWISAGDIARKVHDYILNSTGGDPETLAQLTLFRLKPWEHDACRRLPSAGEVSAYKQWIDGLVVGVSAARSHVAVVVQPDGPFALCSPHGSRVLSRLIRYSVVRLAAVPNTSVYIETGAADWLRDSAVRAARILIPAGVQYARGFALNGTHYDSTPREVRFGAKVARYLAARGYPDKHFVVNTSSNGKPFAGYRYAGRNFDNARVCRSTSDYHCVTLGIPPTADVANPAWHLSSSDSALAATYADAYLWFGRPWLYMQADPFVMSRAIGVASTTPF